MGNPCDITTGNKYQTEIDFQIVDNIPKFVRYYNSLDAVYYPLHHKNNNLGIGWSSNLSAKKLSIEADIIFAMRGDGKGFAFKHDGNNWVSDDDVKLTLITTENGYSITDNTTIETYDNNGYLVTENNNNNIMRYEYNNNLISRVIGAYGHSIKFSYNSDNTIKSITTPNNENYYYEYDNNNLVKITYPDGSFRIYHYEDNNFPNNLTGITNQNGVRFATYDYDGRGYVISTEHAQTSNTAPQEKYTFSYGENKTYITQPNGVREYVQFEENLGKKNVVYKQTMGGRSAQKTTQEFDDNNNLIKRYNAQGKVETYTYDEFNRLITKTNALGEITEYEYLNNNSQLVSKITTNSILPSKQKHTSIQYDDNFNVISITRAGFNNKEEQIVKTQYFKYNTNNQLITIDGFREDVADIATYEYYQCNTGGKCGKLKNEKDALGNIITYDKYNDNGLLLEKTHHGIKYIYKYNTHNKLIFKQIGNQITHYEYDLVGNLTQLKQHNSTIFYTYDDANYLREIKDEKGNKITYTYDTTGNIIETITYDNNDELLHKIVKEYNDDNDIKTINNAGKITQLSYNYDSEIIKKIDPNANEFNYTYDKLGNITTTTHPNGATEKQTYLNNQLIGFNDNKDNDTNYFYDDFNNLEKTISPDSGTTLYNYDKAGNIIQKIDANNATTKYSYDAINRLIKAQYADGNVITYAYNKQHLISSNYQNGNTTYTYNNAGLLTKQSQTTHNTTLNLAYEYNTHNQLTKLIYPSGKVIEYTYNNNKITTIKVDSTTVVSDIIYYPFSTKPKSWLFFNGAQYKREYSNGLVSSYTVNDGVNYLTYDNNNNIVDISGKDSNNFSYNQTNNLIDENSNNYILDPNANRTADASNTYTIDDMSNKILDIIENTHSFNYQYDNNGNILSDGVNSYEYNSNNQLSKFNNSVFYNYNHHNQRILKHSNYTTLINSLTNEITTLNQNIAKNNTQKRQLDLQIQQILQEMYNE